MPRSMKKPWIINIVGRSGSGKTTLVERLIRHYVGLGCRVSAVKSMRHDFEIDYPGKDSHRYREAGAFTSIIANREKYAMVTDIDDDRTPLDIATGQCGSSDVLIIEGFREGGGDKIEVIGCSGESPLYQSGISNIRILVTDKTIRAEVPVFKRDDIAGIVAALEKLRDYDSRK